MLIFTNLQKNARNLYGKQLIFCQAITLQNPQLLRYPTCFNGAFYLKLAQNLLTVPADCVHTDRKLTGNLLAHQPLIYQPENLFLSVRQDLCILLTT